MQKRYPSQSSGFIQSSPSELSALLLTYTRLQVFHNFLHIFFFLTEFQAQEILDIGALAFWSWKSHVVLCQSLSCGLSVANPCCAGCWGRGPANCILAFPADTQFNSVQLCPTLRPHGLQHARFPCPSPTPGACSNSCRLNQWCHPTISFSVLFSSCLQSFQASGSFPMSQFFASGGQSIGVSAQHQSFQRIFRTDFL